MEGYKIVVYIDDKIKNCDNFREAALKIKLKYPKFNFRQYNILNDNSSVSSIDDNYFKIGNLEQIIENEKTIL